MELKFNSHFVHSFSEISAPFNMESFSEFKYGNTHIAKNMAIELVNFFKINLFNKNSNNRYIIYSSPYSQIPTASLFLTQYFIEVLLSEFPKLDLNLEKIERNNTYSQDYGLMSADQRFQLISKDTYSLNHLPNKDAVLIFIDDVSITGTHQRVIENLIFENSIQNEIVFLYYAKLINNSDPKFESQLNNFKIKKWDDLAKLMLSSVFKFNTRTIKYLLSLDNEEFYLMINVLQKNKPQLISNLLVLAESNNYDKIEAYKNNFMELKKIFKQLKSYV
jgi:hypothetical protein